MLQVITQPHINRRKGEQGQALIIFTLSLVGLLMTLALVLNAGLVYAARQALHNSTDLSTTAAVDYMEFNRNGSDANVFAAVYGVMKKNISNASWSADYVDSSGNVIIANGSSIQVGESSLGNCNHSTGNCGDSSAPYPSNAVGVTMSASYPINTFFGGITKQANVTVGADSKTVVNRTGILSTSKWAWHDVYAASSGKFTVNGDIDVKSTLYTNAYSHDQVDGFDAKQGSSIVVNGYINTVGTYPLDGNCKGEPGQSPNVGSQFYDPSTGLYVFPCYAPNYPTSISLAGANIGLSTNDPVFNNQFATLSPPSPGCGASHTVTNSSPVIWGYKILPPGTYTGGGPGQPVVFDLSYGSIVLDDCQTYYGAGNVPSPYGAYDFPNGLIVTDSSPNVNTPSYELYGTDVILYSSGHFTPPQAHTYPYPNAAVDENYHHQVTYTQAFTYTYNEYDYYPFAAGDVSPYDSFRFGGVNIGLIYLSAPASGPYKGLALMGEPTVEGNISFDTYYQDNATIVINGSIYTTWKYSPPYSSYPWWWGEGNAIQSGFNDWLFCDPATTFCPNQSQGNVTINGLAAADFFQTAGRTDVTVNAPTVRLWQLN